MTSNVGTVVCARTIRAMHAWGNPVVRNLIEGRPQQVLAILDKLAAG
jgi:hypothetical protein